MRSLTSSQAKIVQALLAEDPGEEAARVAASGASKTSYVQLRRRALLDRWLGFRYFPDPRLLEITSVRFRVARPYADRWREARRLWAESDGTVLLWTTPEVFLSVVWQGGERGRATASSPIPAERDLFADAWEVGCEANDAEVPVYFDFEGAWARLSNLGPTLSYPRGISLPLDGHGPSPGAWPLQAQRATARELLANSALPEVDEPPSSFLHRRLPRRSPKIAAVRQWVRQRALLDLASVPTVGGRRIERLYLVTGLIRRGSSARSLLFRLAREVGAAPFLCAFDSERALLGLVGASPPPDEGRRPSIMGPIGDVLEKVTVCALPTDGLRRVVDHRYDRLLREASPTAAPHPLPLASPSPGASTPTGGPPNEGRLSGQRAANGLSKLLTAGERGSGGDRYRRSVWARALPGGTGPAVVGSSVPWSPPLSPTLKPLNDAP